MVCHAFALTAELDYGVFFLRSLDFAAEFHLNDADCPLPLCQQTLCGGLFTDRLASRARKLYNADECGSA